MMLKQEKILAIRPMDSKGGIVALGMAVPVAWCYFIELNYFRVRRWDMVTHNVTDVVNLRENKRNFLAPDLGVR